MSTKIPPKQRNHPPRWTDHAFFLILIFLAVVLLLVSIFVNLKR